MKSITSSLCLLILFFGLQTFAKDPKKPYRRLYVSHYENVLGTSLSFKITTTAEAEAEKAENAALAEIDRLSAIFSAYDNNSEFSKWMKQDLNTPVKVSKELFDMLSLFEQWRSRTNGALNASAAVANNLWKNAASKQQLPSTQELQNAVATIKQTHYRLDQNNLTATRLTHAPLVMNTFAKSYIINLACDAALALADINAIVVNIGGDLVIKGDFADQVNVTNPLANADNDAPLAYLSVANKAVATSGNYRRGEQIGKKWYSHIIDPRTALPVNGVISATVIAPNATDAGALATAFNVLSLAESEALATTVYGAEYLIITKDGKKIESRGWKTYESKPSLIVEQEPQQSKGSKVWDAKYELSIAFEMNAIAGNNRRPFAAIWVENENRELVRNLALWYNKPKWVPDLKNWYRINGANFKVDKANYASITGATRSPGKYTIKWDGKDDKGNFVEQGKYTVIIETSKEHGTDEMIRQPMEFKKAAKKMTSKGNVEISNVIFDFHKKK